MKRAVKLAPPEIEEAFQFGVGRRQIVVLPDEGLQHAGMVGHLVEDLSRDDVYRSHPSGFIGLQVHGIRDRGPFEMKFRSIRIRELKRTSNSG